MKKQERYTQETGYSHMKPGFYEIQVLIESTQGLFVSRGTDINAMITVQAFREVKFSKVRNNVSHQLKMWGEHFYFSHNFIKTDNESLERSLIKIKVWDHNRVLTDALVGEYQLSVHNIYSRQGHILKHSLLALSNVTKNYGEISGLVKVSISVLGEEDKRIPLEMQSMASFQKDTKIMMPTNVERKSYQLTVDIYEGKEIKPVDGETVDPYIGVEFGMIYSRTQTVVNNCNPQWNQKVQVPVHLPASIDNIILRLIDSNVFQSKQVLGSCYLSITKLLKEYETAGEANIQNDNNNNRYDKMQWINMYGSQTVCKNNEAKRKYSIYPDHAPYYVGSILVKASIQQKNNPVKEHTKHPKKDKNDLTVIGSRPYIYYRVEVDFELGMNLPSQFKNYAMDIRIGGDLKERPMTKKVRNKCGFATWFCHHQFCVKFYENQQFPDIFVYLINEDNQRICFQRHKPILVLNSRQWKVVVENKWRMMKPDLTMISIHSEEAGYVKYGLEITKADRNRTFKSEFSELVQKSIHHIDKEPCYIVIDLYCAEGLLAGDDDGSADPYFRFTFQENALCSSTKSCTVNPVYLQRLIIEGTIGENNSILPMFVTAFNKNPIRDQTIGVSYIDLEKGLKDGSIKRNTNFNNQPRWFNLNIQDINLGRFLAGITIIQKKTITPSKQLAFFENELSDFQINLFILGLRNLKNNGLVSIRRPYVEFDFDSLYQYGTKEIKKLSSRIQLIKEESKLNEFSKNVKTEPNELGTSINIKTSNKTVLRLPKNIDLWPNLTAKVSNQVVGGLYEPIIGYFSINLKEAFKRTMQIKQEFTSKQKNLSIQELSEDVARQSKLANINQDLIKKLRCFIVRNINYNWQEVSQGIEGKLNKLQGQQNKRKKLDYNYIVLLPKYAFNKEKNIYLEQYKEIITKNGEYIKIGYDTKQSLKTKTKDQRNRHYRYCLKQPFQSYYQRVNGVKLGVYDELAIRRGRVLLPEEKNQFFTKLVSDQDIEVGFYKGNCLVTERQSSQEERSRIDESFQKVSQQKLSEYMTREKFMMYLYIIRASNIPSKGLSATPNPYIIVKLGDKQISFKDQHQKETANPQFNILVKEYLTFPEDSEIEIKVYNADFIGLLDELIGQTVVHAENRVFSQFGKIKFNNPVETHYLKVRQSRQQQGELRFWVDFVPVNQIDLYKEFDISSTANHEFEVRIIIWGCDNIASEQNDFTDMVDLYVTCEFNGEVKQTDTHYRSQSGQGSFNWRMLFPIKYPLADDSVTFKIYDKDIILSDDALAFKTIFIGKYLEQAYDNEMGVKLFEGTVDMKEQKNLPCQFQKDPKTNSRRYDIFDVELSKRESQKDARIVRGANVQISIEILPRYEAERKKAGEGRSQPNAYPNLPEPTGRMQWSWNPITMLTRLCGKRFKNKILLAMLCFLCITLVIYIVPALIGSLISKAV